ncbi:hypothetical protein SLEP1_g38466 [Rubroshorea leprosula]|nr:hypothetical protein SLEP1_g38466 [Rubroshorea leprosula]
MLSKQKPRPPAAPFCSISACTCQFHYLVNLMLEASMPSSLN